MREGLQGLLYELVESRLPENAGAMRLLASRYLKAGLKGEGLVEGIRLANEAMIKNMGASRREEVVEEYRRFVEEWKNKEIDENLVRKGGFQLVVMADCTQKEYLVACVGSVYRISRHEV